MVTFLGNPGPAFKSRQAQRGGGFQKTVAARAGQSDIEQRPCFPVVASTELL
ncbi:MAG: hypothetical protein ACT6T0_05300 [Nevskia sp.]